MHGLGPHMLPEEVALNQQCHLLPVGLHLMCPEFLGTFKKEMAWQMRAAAKVTLIIFLSVSSLILSSTLMSYVTRTERIRSQIQATKIIFFKSESVFSFSDVGITQRC